jgi:oligogalacturonide lyase
MMERIHRIDARTGIEVVQLTSYPVMHHHQYCYGQWIAPDEQTILFFRARELTRSSAVDLWRVCPDGSDLAMLVEGASWSAIGVDGRTLYTGVGNRVVSVPIDSGGDSAEELAVPETIHELAPGSSVMVNAASRDGRFIFCHTVQSGEHVAIRIDLASSEAAELFRTPSLMHMQLHDADGGQLLASVIPPGMEYGIYTFSFDGGDFQKLPFTNSTNHYASLGRTGKVITSVHSPAKAIEIATPGDDTAEVLCGDLGYWHPTCDESGEWIASDTNWPDTGLYLIHAPTGRYRVLCYPEASGGHPQWTHAHPRMSPDANYVVFDSDRTGGICHVYAAHIPPEFKEQLRRGVLRRHVGV